jgi:anti-sigma-K factor RskA
MNTAPQNPELIDRLAAEYVLGTLRGAARRRFARWRETSAVVDERCGYWEQRLLPLLGPARRIEPSPSVWSGIRLRLGLEAERARRRGDLPLALAATVLLATALGLLLHWRTPPARALEVATIASPSGSLLWRVEVYGEPGAAAGIDVRSGATGPPPGRDYELWALPTGAAPVSLGVLPHGEGSVRHTLTAAQQRALAGAAQLAVSVEPPGGSPTGQPTGAVVFVAELRNAG